MSNIKKFRIKSFKKKKYCFKARKYKFKLRKKNHIRKL